MSHLSDDDLIAAASHARDMAHNAPGPPSEAFFLWAREWSQLRDEIKRRGLTLSQETGQ